jgi:hypothetical protein
MSGDRVGRTSSTRQRLQFSLLTLLALVGLSACLLGLWMALDAKRPPRLSGIVTYQGEPIESAVIQFDPLDPTGDKLSAAIVDGRYAVKAGLLPGRYAVGIRDSRKVLPAEYNLPKTSGLSATMPDTQAILLNFDLH